MEKKKNRSRKRDAILACLAGTKTHPSADWVYRQLKPDFPDLSLGTVYRNLSEFLESGQIISVGSVGGLERYDYDVSPHAHFICRKCHAVIDVREIPLPPLPELPGTLEACAVTFTGVCNFCQSASSDAQ
ncbi:MAG: transcriptional repressor [Clostridia bacterium]|nr:transcriptional repressor [Clostridia bacterium]